MEVFSVVISSVVPVFAIIGLGLAFGRSGKFDIRSFIDFVIYVAQPCLIITALTRHHIAPGHLLLTGLGNVFVVSAVGFAALSYARISGDRGRDLLVCAMFANAANLPLPLAQIAFGAEGLSYQVVYMTVNAVLLYTVGVALAEGGPRGWVQVLKLPLVYATALGLGFSISQTQLPLIVARPVGMLGDTAIPLMLFILGYTIGSTKLDKPTGVAPIVGLRVLGGLAAGVAFVALFDPPGPVRRAVLLGCCMPSAVQTFMLCAKSNQNSARAAAAVFTSTILAFIYIPLVVFWLTGLL